MKLNMPVTQKEIELIDTSSIVSKTDLKGHITYINRDFMEISGFVESELIGKNHNVIRHPDMPPEAFADLWNTVKAGKPWNGMVKNRCKNGDHYWVEANVAPLREKGEVTGYMSVRSKATRQQIDEAEALYKDLRAGKVIKEGLFAKLSRYIADAPLMLKVGAPISLPIFSLLLWFNNEPLTKLLEIATVGAVAAIASVFALRKYVVSPIKRATDAANAIADGDFSFRICTKANDEAGRMMQAIKAMQIRIGFEVSNNKKIADEGIRLQTALDNSTSAFTFGDSDNKLQYINATAKAIWQEMAAEISKVHAHFNIDSMIGNNIGQYFENANERAIFAEKLKDYKNLGIVRVVIEEPLLNSNNVYTIQTLLRFNSFVFKEIYNILGIVPEFISTYNSRKFAFPELVQENDKKKFVLFGGLPKDIDKKEIIWKKVSSKEPQITWLYTKNNTIKKECYDMSDSYTCVLGYMKQEKIW
jgi:methyl-accepting chemotaxis protein